MGLIDRHTGAPYVEGEVLDAGTEVAPEGLEIDIKRFYAEFNGGIDNANFKVGADISGTKFGIATVTGAKFATAAITAAKVLDQSIVNAKFTDDAITLAKLQDNSITQLEQESDDTLSLIWPIVYTTIISDSIITGIGVAQRVLIFYRVELEVTGDMDYVQFRLRRSGTVLFEGQLADYAGTGGSATKRSSVYGVWLDTGAPAGASVTYDVQFQGAAADADEKVISGRINLLNVRR